MSYSDSLRTRDNKATKGLLTGELEFGTYSSSKEYNLQLNLRASCVLFSYVSFSKVASRAS